MIAKCLQAASQRPVDARESHRMRSNLLRIQLEHGSLEEPGDPSSMAAEEVRRLFKSGNLTDSAIEGAAEAGRREFIVAALSRMARVPVDTVRRILDTHTAKPVTALVWRAGLSMRTAFKIQTFVMRLPAGELLPARRGIDFPLSEEEMRWHLDYFAVPVL